jgi:uncharacterized protein
MSLRTKLRDALPAAIKAQDRGAIAALRSALAAIDNAEAVAAPTPPPPGSSEIAGAVTGLGSTEAVRAELSDDEVDAVVRAEIADRRTAAADYERLGRTEDAARLAAEADVLAAHLATS